MALFKPFSLATPEAKHDHDGHILRQAAGIPEPETSRWPVALHQEGETLRPPMDWLSDAFRETSAGAELTVVEGIGGLGGAVGPASQQIAQGIDAQSVVVVGYYPGLGIQEALDAKRLFGERLVGVVINGVTRYRVREVRDSLVPRMEAEGIKVLATIPEDRSLLGVSVGQLAEHLDGKFLTLENKKDGFVEHLLIGGMMLDWGVPYFQRFSNKAVIVRGDRPDIQMAALATPTSCIVLTGGHPPIQYVRYQAEEARVPLIQVEGDTLSAAGALESLQERALFDHPVKQERFLELMSRHGRWEALYQSLGI